MEDHLIIIIVIVLNDEHLIINNRLIFINLKLNINGNDSHIVIEHKIFISGDIIYIVKFDFRFRFNSFPISLIASEIG